MSQPFIDLTPEVRRELNLRRRAPLWNVLWLGFALGVAFTVLAFVFVSLLGGHQ